MFWNFHLCQHQKISNGNNKGSVIRPTRQCCASKAVVSRELRAAHWNARHHRPFHSLRSHLGEYNINLGYVPKSKWDVPGRRFGYVRCFCLCTAAGSGIWQLSHREIYEKWSASQCQCRYEFGRCEFSGIGKPPLNTAACQRFTWASSLWIPEYITIIKLLSYPERE